MLTCDTDQADVALLKDLQTRSCQGLRRLLLSHAAVAPAGHSGQRCRVALQPDGPRGLGSAAAVTTRGGGGAGGLSSITGPHAHGRPAWTSGPSATARCACGTL